MNPRRFGIHKAALVLAFVVGGAAGLQWTIGQAAPAGNDIQLGAPTTDVAMIITPTFEGGELKDDHHGERLSVQEFTFNPATHEIALSKDSPGAHRVYGNTRIDAAYYGSDLNIFDYLTAAREPIGKIVLTCAKKKLVISSNYIVSRPQDDPTPVDPATFCAGVQYVKGDESKKPGTTVTVSRNGDAAIPAADGLVSKINRKTDVMTWKIERDGAVVKTGSFGFPVVATEPDLVKYVVQLP